MGTREILVQSNSAMQEESLGVFDASISRLRPAPAGGDAEEVKCSIRTLVGSSNAPGVARIINGEEPYVARILDLLQVQHLAEHFQQYRKLELAEGADGLNAVRHNLGVLSNVQLPYTRFIICSVEGRDNYPDIDRLLAEDEFAAMIHRVVLTAEPNYLARCTTANQEVSYQRGFLNAVKGQNQRQVDCQPAINAYIEDYPTFRG